MRRAGQITLAAALLISSDAPGALAQSAIRSGASTVVGSAGSQQQTSSSKFLGSTVYGSSSWQAGNGSFGKRGIANDTRPGLVDSSKRVQAGRVATLVTAQGESARTEAKKRFAIPGLRAEAPKSQSTGTTALAQRNVLKHKKPLAPQVQFGAPKRSVAAAQISGSGNLPFGGKTRTTALGGSTNPSALKSQFGKPKP